MEQNPTHRKDVFGLEPILDRLSARMRRKLESEIPQLQALRQAYVQHCRAGEQAVFAGCGLDEANQARAQFIAQMNEQTCALLRAHGYDPAHLETGYACERCRDCGYVIVQGAKVPCTCQKAQTKLALQEPLPAFADFDDTLYPSDVQRSSARQLQQRLQAYACDFPHVDRPHFMLYGAPGLGKSFFLGCTAQALRTRGFVVQYLSAYRLICLFREQHMGGRDALRTLSQCDFLAIDDLGTEPLYRNITIEYLNALVDTRMRYSRATAVATNLNAAELTERYGERIVSRLCDKYNCALYGLRGQDLRRHHSDQGHGEQLS